jgi:hypothetical protein
MNVLVRSDQNKAKRAVTITLSNGLANSVFLYCYFRTMTYISNENLINFQAKFFELISFEAFSYIVAISEIYGQQFNSYVHLVVNFNTFVETLFYRPEFSLFHKGLIIFFFILKSIYIQKSKTNEYNNKRNLHVLSRIRNKIEKFHYFKNLYGNFLIYSVFKDLFSYFYYKRDREFLIELLLLSFNKMKIIFTRKQLKQRLWMEVVTVFIYLAMNSILITIKTNEFNFSRVFAFFVTMIYMFFVFLYYTIEALAVKHDTKKTPKDPLDP